jgi:hypothetical protein
MLSPQEQHMSRLALLHKWLWQQGQRKWLLHMWLQLVLRM